jgi:hypothetical protein
LELHFVERSTEVSGLNGLDSCAAFVADDVREIATLEREQKSAALLISKIRVQQNMLRRLHLPQVYPHPT